ncbi:MAG: N-acyl-D-amino-acid deacylase family protein [Pyrinomonadaceae bacterium]
MNSIKKGFALLLLFGLFLNVFGNAMKTETQAKEFDLLIAGGRIVDGTGNPWFYGDVAIKDGRIVEIGRIKPERASRVIDARGKVVSPGFIDVHGHLEGGIEKMPLAENYLQMGVTSVITGNCGTSAIPLGAWFAGLEKQGISINVGSLVGHNSIRHEGMNGDFDRPPTVEELQKMRELVAQSMRDGAVGFSTGLEYVPGIYAKTDEIVALAKVSAASGGIYTTHMRDEGIAVEQAIKESLEVGEQASCPVEISHFKISAKNRWGASEKTIKLVEDARKRGQQVTVDQYLYTAGATTLDIIFPAWLFDGGAAKVKERLTNPETRARVKKDILERAAGQGFEDLSFVQISSYAPDASFNGKRLDEIAALVKKDSSAEAQAELAIEIKLKGGAGVVVHKMSDADVDRIFRQPFTMVAADADVAELVGESSPHPRVFGNNARVLALYTREKKLVSLEEAVRKMTTLPAQTFGLWDRGILRPGTAADIVVFDPDTVQDKATFQNPKQFPTGFDYVIVNGQITIEKGKHTGAKAGQILRGKGFSLKPSQTALFNQPLLPKLDLFAGST